MQTAWRKEGKKEVRMRMCKWHTRVCVCNCSMHMHMHRCNVNETQRQWSYTCRKLSNSFTTATTAMQTAWRKEGKEEIENENVQVAHSRLCLQLQHAYAHAQVQR